MTLQQIADIRRTFDAVAPQADAVAALVYRRLFGLDASLRPLFQHDMREQGRTLMQIQRFTPAVREAWVVVCGTLAEAMQVPEPPTC